MIFNRTLWQTLLGLTFSATLVACGGGNDTPANDKSSTPAGTALSSTFTGDGTYYDASGAGSCSFDPPSQNLMVAAINMPQYGNSALCGAYVQATGPKGTVTVRIVDQCPSCAQGDLDFSAEAFAQIADIADGRVPISWKVVVGDITSPVSYRYQEGSSPYWAAIQVRNHRVPIAAMDVRPVGTSDWIALTRTSYNYFTYAPSTPAGTLQVRITASTGEMLEDTLPAPASGVITVGQMQFP